MIGWEGVAAIMGIGAVILGAGKFLQNINDQGKRISKLEEQLSFSNPDGPAFVHRQLFDMQNQHNEAMLAELKEGIEGLEDKLETKLDETNKLLSQLISLYTP